MHKSEKMFSFFKIRVGIMSLLENNPSLVGEHRFIIIYIELEHLILKSCYMICFFDGQIIN